jgi:hypothetical protein
MTTTTRVPSGTLTIVRGWTRLTEDDLGHHRIRPHHLTELDRERQSAMTYVWGRQDEAQDRDGTTTSDLDEVNGFASTWERHCWEYLTEHRCSRMNMRDAYSRYIAETRAP